LARRSTSIIAQRLCLKVTSRQVHVTQRTQVNLSYPHAHISEALEHVGFRHTGSCGIPLGYHPHGGSCVCVVVSVRGTWTGWQAKEAPRSLQMCSRTSLTQEGRETEQMPRRVEKMRRPCSAPISSDLPRRPSLTQRVIQPFSIATLRGYSCCLPRWQGSGATLDPPFIRGWCRCNSSIVLVL
jgi:hypothetical protein